jgi:hypothetical protein
MKPPVRRTGSRAGGSPAVLGLALLVLAAAGCETRSPLRIRPGPVVPSQSFGVTAVALRKVAIVPFYPLAPGPAPANPATGGTGSTWSDAAQISGYVTEALSAQGIAVVPPNDIELAFTNAGTPVPRLDPETNAVTSARDFGASSVLLGRVLRFREREGSAAGATRPASVSFEVTLYEAPTARKLWVGRFDETQQAITEAILRARQYPGGGTRWLTAAEFARWGATEVAKSIASAR